MTKSGNLRSNINRIMNLAPDFNIEADGRRNYLSVRLAGARLIKEFSDREAVLETKGTVIKLCGEELTVTVFETKHIEIKGFVFGMYFEKKKRNGRRSDEN